MKKYKKNRLNKTAPICLNLIWWQGASVHCVFIQWYYRYLLATVACVFTVIQSHDLSDGHMIITWLWLSHSTWVWHTRVTCSGHVTCPYRPHVFHLHHVITKKAIVKGQLKIKDVIKNYAVLSIVALIFKSWNSTSVIVRLASNVFTWRLPAMQIITKLIKRWGKMIPSFFLLCFFPESLWMSRRWSMYKFLCSILIDFSLFRLSCSQQHNIFHLVQVL